MYLQPSGRLLRCAITPLLQLRQVVCQQAIHTHVRSIFTIPRKHWVVQDASKNLPWCRQQVMYYAKKAKKEKKDKDGKGGKPKVTLTHDELNQVINYDKMCNQMEQVVDHLKTDFIKQLSLRSNLGALNQLSVDTCDGQFPLIQLGQVTQKTPQLVVVNMAINPQYIGDVKKAIAESGMNLNPQQDATTLFVPIPKLTKEHRENLAKNAKTLSVKAKDKLRDVHNSYVRDVKKGKNNYSADLIHSLQEHIDQKMREYVSQTENILAKKQKELLLEK